jgi:protein involved in polysaccharide export with SLBB domain
MRPILCALAFSLGFIAIPMAGQDSPDRQVSRGSDESLVGPEDTLTIVALNCEEISKPWRVGVSGEINLPMAGTVRAAGKTVEQIEQEIAFKLRPFILEPQVTVYVSELRSRPITVTGAVVNPGILQLQGSRTLFSAIMLAGGFKTGAATITLTRSVDRGRIEFAGASEVDDKFSVLELPVKDVADGHSAAANLVVQPQDVISVAEDKEQRLVHIMGDVAKPGAVELVNQSTISLMKLLAVAGGLTRTSSPQNALIRHIGPEGIQSEMSKVNLKTIIEGKAKDLELTAGDIVVVPSSDLKFYLETAPQAGLAAGFMLLGKF